MEVTMAARQCPECELRFATEIELRDHLDSDHGGQIGPPPDYPPRSQP